MPRQVDFYQDAGGSVPVEDFLDGLPKPQRAKALALIKLLEGRACRFLIPLRFRGRLRELRTQLGKTRLRILYFGDPRRTFIPLHGFIKVEKKLPRACLQIAEQRLAAYLHRLERRK